MAVLCLSAIIFYMYFINQTIHQVALRATLEQELAERTARIGELEFSYIALSNKIDMPLAEELGFKETHPHSFVSRKHSVAFNSSSLRSR